MDKRHPNLEKTRTQTRRAPAAGHPPAACYCYIVECADGTFYTGWTTDTERRVKVHNAGRGARYTSMRRPVRLVYVEAQPDRTTAMRRERAIKRLPRLKKQALVAGFAQPAARLRRSTSSRAKAPDSSAARKKR